MAIQPPLAYKIASGTESIGQHGILGLKIETYHSAFEYDPRNPDHAKLQDALYDAKEKIEQEMIAIAIASDPKSAQLTADWKDAFLSSFPPKATVYVEPIPNRYCSRACCRHLPWYRITTIFGVIELGWRKRVASLDWSESGFKARADTLFPFEKVTKGEHSIHADTMEKVKEYLHTLFHTFDPVTFPAYVAPAPKTEDAAAVA